MPTRTRIGAEIAAERPELIGGARVGLLTNFTGTMPDLSRNVESLVGAGVPLVRLFGPEHGMNGAVQAGVKTPPRVKDERSGLWVDETYLADEAALDGMLVDAGVDSLVFDMQDIGSRYYTYIWSMYDAMRACARQGVRFVVLDRPNPLGGAVCAGPGLTDPTCASFVGRADIFQRHGLTAGELARLFAGRDIAEEGLELDLTVVAMQGWDAREDFVSTGLAWVPPSPNMPTLDSAFAFSGTGLLEGTTLSEGRGTTRPFEIVGAPFLDAGFAARLRDAGLEGVLFRETWFQPTFHKFAGELARGVQVHIVDRRRFDPVATALAILEAAKLTAADQVTSLGAGERVDPGSEGFALDRLWGSSTLREALNGDIPFSALDGGTRAVGDVYGADVLLYER